MTNCAPGYLFIGSRLGSSVFLHYVFEQMAVEDPVEKKPKFDLAEEDEDIELYGQPLPTVNYVFFCSFISTRIWEFWWKVWS